MTFLFSNVQAIKIVIIWGVDKLLCCNFEEFVKQIGNLKEGIIWTLGLTKNHQDGNKNSKARKRILAEGDSDTDETEANVVDALGFSFYAARFKGSLSLE